MAMAMNANGRRSVPVLRWVAVTDSGRERVEMRWTPLSPDEVRPQVRQAA